AEGCRHPATEGLVSDERERLQRMTTFAQLRPILERGRGDEEAFDGALATGPVAALVPIDRVDPLVRVTPVVARIEPEGVEIEIGREKEADRGRGVRGPLELGAQSATEVHGAD